MKNLVEALERETNKGRTENGMFALKSSTDALVDLFSTVSTLRTADEYDIVNKFEKAYKEDKLLALKMLFYIRNIRGTGQGERRVARIIFKYMAENHIEDMRANLNLVPVFGRFDDLLSFIDTPLQDDMLKLLSECIQKDRTEKNDNNLTLVGKWLPSINTSSEQTRKYARVIVKYLKMTDKEYRKMCSEMRARINVVETKMTAKKFGDIKYEAVPSKAMANYKEAFLKQDTSRFSAYVDSLKKGEAKINAAALYPYEILEKMGLSTSWSSVRLTRKSDILEAQWKALPNYIEGENDCLIVADTSGSMEGRPLATAISLALYFAERNKGIWKDKMITFSERAEFVSLVGNTVAQRVSNIPSIVANTNIESVFNLILQSAINNRLSPEQMVKQIIIVSDLQFDRMVDDKNVSYSKVLKDRFEDAGYPLPKLTYWNVAGRQYDAMFHCEANDKGIQTISGSSPSIFKQVVTGISTTPYELMVEVLSDKIFDCVHLGESK